MAASLEDCSFPFQLQLTAAFARGLRIAALHSVGLPSLEKSASQNRHFTMIAAAAPEGLCSTKLAGFRSG